MEKIFEETAISNAPVHTHLAKNSILWQCLYVLQTVSEFKNLTYRVTKTWNELEVVVIYRERALGIFGPPIDPITLVIDQKGKCLLYIPFRPVQRVSIVSSEFGRVEIPSLLAMLKMVAGNGYLFCPGLPEKFLIGKACAKFVVLHNIPFKRYQSSLCPVYYQTQVNQQKSAKSSLCALCPRCMQAAKWIQSLSGTNGKGKTTQLSDPNCLQTDKKNIVFGSSASNNVITEVNECTTIPSAKIVSFPNLNSSNDPSLIGRPHNLNFQLGNNLHDKPTSKLDINGNSKTSNTLNNSKCGLVQAVRTQDIKSSLNTKILEKKLFLRSLLQKRSMKKTSISDYNIEAKDLKVSEENTRKLFNTNKFTRRKNKYKNNCRQCGKEFSTPANLMNHIQRHEALSAAWCKQYKKHKLTKSYTNYFSNIYKIMSRGSFPTFQYGKKNVHLSKTSLRLILKYLDDVILACNVTKSLKQPAYIFDECKNVSEAEKKIELKQEKPDPFHCEQLGNNEAQVRQYTLKRDSSCLSPMQTLLKAAIMAGSDNDVTSPTISSSSSMVLGKQPEVAVVSSTTQSSPSQQDSTEASTPEKKARKSLRLSSKNDHSNNQKAEEYHSNEISGMKNGLSESYSPMLNCNHPSMISTKPVIIDALAQNSTTVSYSVPTSFYSNIDSSASNSFTYNFTSNHQQLLKSSQNALHIHGSQRKEPLIKMSIGSDSSLLPPFLTEADSNYKFFRQNQLNQPQLVSSASLNPAKMDISSGSFCGAIDLSKPKITQTALNIPPSEIKSHLTAAFPGPSHNTTQLDTSNRHEALQYLMMMNMAAESGSQVYKESQIVNVAATNKKTDPNFQSHLLACKQTKIDKGEKITGYGESVVAAFSGKSKAKKTGYDKNVLSDEIHCGGKWTGSGGLVKERTQVVRELVPSHVMANILSKPWAPAAVTQTINLPNNSHSLPVLSSNFVLPTQTIPQDMSSSHYALNLTVKRPNEVKVLNKEVSNVHQKLASSVATSMLSYVSNLAPIVSVSSEINILKSLMSNSLKSEIQHTSNIPVTSDIHAQSITNTNRKMRHKSKHHVESSKSSLLAITTSSSNTISSPSLAAMLLQPAIVKHKAENSDTYSHIYEATASTKLLNIENITADMALSSVNNSVKTEPNDSHIQEQDLTFQSTDSMDNLDDRSPPNLVMDINSEPLNKKKDKRKALELKS